MYIFFSILGVHCYQRRRIPAQRIIHQEGDPTSYLWVGVQHWAGTAIYTYATREHPYRSRSYLSVTRDTKSQSSKNYFWHIRNCVGGADCHCATTQFLEALETAPDVNRLSNHRTSNHGNRQKPHLQAGHGYILHDCYDLSHWVASLHDRSTDLRMVKC